MSLPYTFEPLFDFLEQLDITLDDLVAQNMLLKQTADKIKNGQPVMLSTAAKLCISLGCDMSDIVALNYAYDPSEQDEALKNEPVVNVSTTKNERIGYNPWTEEEEERLIEEYYRGEKLTEIAKKHNRTRGGIVARINRLKESGRITDASVFVQSEPEAPVRIPVVVSDAPRDSISISVLAKQISERTQRKVKYEDIASWLVSVKDLDEYIEVGKKIRVPTKQGEHHGIIRGKKTNASGIEYIGVFLLPAGQRYILDNLLLIFAFIDRDDVIGHG